MSYRSRIVIVIRNNFAWVWYSFLYWIHPSFTNHLKFRWFHYKFCRRKGEVFLIQFYLSQWRAYIEDVLFKHPENIIPSHGLQAILIMIRENKSEKLIAFLESENIEPGMETFINELKILNNIDSELKSLPPLNQAHTSNSFESVISDLEDNNVEADPSFEDIHGRTWVIGLHIHYQLFISLDEYKALTGNRAKYLLVIKAQFRVDRIKTKYKDIDYNYLEILQKGTGSEKGQLRRQLKQILKYPSVFGERVVLYVKDLLKNHFMEDF